MDDTTPEPGFYTIYQPLNISMPEPSGWVCELFGFGPNGITVAHCVGQPFPNTFQRWMQRVFFGNKWIRR